MNLPSVIFFINSDLNEPLKATLISQLRINDFMDGYEFDDRVAVDPNYPTFVHLQQLRIMVMRPSLRNISDRTLADVVLFVKQGLASVEFYKNGPPSLTLPVANLNIFNLLEGIRSMDNSITCRRCVCGCRCNCFKHLPIQLQQMLINIYDISGVHDANCDNQFNNADWINRK